MATTVPTINQVISAVPEPGHRGVDTKDDFVAKQEAYQDHQRTVLVGELNTRKDEANAQASVMNEVSAEFEITYANIANKESLLSPHYTAIDALGNETTSAALDRLSAATTPDSIDLLGTVTVVENINSVATNISNINDVNENQTNIDLVATDIRKGIGTNQQTDSSILNALTNATIATTQAGLASNSANSAYVSANEALTASNTAVAMSGIDYASFTVNNGELVLGYYDETASTPSIIDGEFIITY